MKNIHFAFILIALVFLQSCISGDSKKPTENSFIEIEEEEYYVECDYCYGYGVVSQKCYNCNGRGRLTAKRLKYYACNHCVGTGKLPCQSCDSYGYHICSKCKGSGSHKCDVCGGSGKIYQSGYFLTCYKCDGDGYPPCWSCSGRGKLMCEACWGTRFVKCTYCGGKGHNGESYFEDVDNGECPQCEGYGKIRVECDICDGEGKIKKTRIVRKLQ